MAAKDKSVLSLDVQPTLDTRELERQHAALSKKLAAKEQQEIAKMQKSGMSPAMLSGISASYKRQRDELKKNFETHTKQVEVFNRKALTGENAARAKAALWDKERKLQDAKGVPSAALVAVRKQHAVQDALYKQQQQRQAETRRKAFDKFEKKAGRYGMPAAAAESLYESVKSKQTFGQVLPGAQRGIAGAVKNAPDWVKAGNKEGAGALAKTLGSLGGTVTKMAGALAVASAVLGGLAVAVKMIIDADAAMKELNRTLLDGGSSAADMSGKFGDLTTNLSTVRESFTSFEFNRVWGTGAADHYKILNAYSNAGLTFQEIAGNAKDASEQVKRFQEASSVALTYSKLLGESSDTVAGHIGEMMEEMALTLGGVSEQFSAITAAATESGFSTKRFYGQVIQATSGMAMYNVSIADTVGLLTHLDKTLGVKAGGEMMQQLNQGFKQVSTQDRIRKTMLLGEEAGGSIAAREATTQADVFLKGVQELVKSVNPDEAAAGKRIQEALEGASLDISDSGAFAKQLGKLNKEQSDVLQATVGAVNPTMGTKLGTLGQAALGTRGGRENIQASMETWGPAGKALADIKNATALIGKNITDIEANDEVLRIAAEQLGISNEQYRQYNAVAVATNGMLTQLGKIRSGQLTPEEFNNLYTKGYGVEAKMIGDKLSVVSTKTGKVIGEGFDEMFTATFAADESKKGDAKTDRQLAEQVADNTTDMTKILEQGIEAWLSDIYDATSGIWKWLQGKSLSSDEKAVITKEQERIKGELAAKDKEIAEARKAGDSKKVATLVGEKDVLKEQSKGLHKAEGGRVFDKSAEEFAEEGRKSNALAKIRALQGQGIKADVFEKDKAQYGWERDDHSVEVLERMLATMQAEAKKKDEERRKTPEGKSAIALVGGATKPPAKDWIAHIGSEGVEYAQRISPGDTVVASEPNGALDKASKQGKRGSGSSGGGTKVVHNHFYNDGAGIWNSLKNYDQAMGNK